MLEIGLTGGIGSGKSTVAQLLVTKGAHLIDADRLVKELQEPGQTVYVAMVERWGDGIVSGDGALDRQAVADIVFSEPDELKALNQIVHPAVGAEMQARREQHQNTDHTVVLDIPLLVETGYDNFGGIVVVDVEPEIAVARLVEHRGFPVEDARNRVASQASREDRLARADFVVENHSTLTDVEHRVDVCWAWIETLERPEPGAPINRILSRVEQEAAAEEQ